MKLVVLGLSLSSSWGNGHATTYRALLEAFASRGHGHARCVNQHCRSPSRYTQTLRPDSSTTSTPGRASRRIC